MVVGTITVSFKPHDFQRVFGIPDRGESTSKPTTKMMEERKDFLLRLVCRSNLTTAEWKSLWASSNSRGLKRSFIANGDWQCLMDLVKSRLTRTSRASDIAIWMIGLMNGLSLGRVYNWSQLLSDRIHDFLSLEHKTFYMCHHAICLFLEVVRTQVPSEKGKFQSQGRVEPNKPAMYYWIHWDTLGGDAIQSARKKRKQDEEEGSSNEDTEVEEEETEDLESRSGEEGVPDGTAQCGLG